jgi:hypothetical protein
LLIGVALAFLWHPQHLRPVTGRLAPAALDLVGALSLGMVVITFMTVHDYDIGLYHGGFLLLSVWTALLIATLAHPAAQIGRGVGMPPARWLGVRSYSFYLWHWPVMQLTRPGIDVSIHGPLLFVLQLAATIALADLSYRYVEQPFRRSRGWTRPDWLRIGRLGIAVGVTLVVIVVGWSGIAPSGSSGGTSPASAQIVGRSDVRDGSPAVLAIGDSVMVDARTGLARRVGPNLTLNAAVGRQPGEIISLLHGYAAGGGLPDDVVIQMGNNGPVYGEDLLKLHDALRGVPRVYLVNVDVPRSWQGEVNSILHEAAQNWGQARLVDWHAIASKRDVTTDGVHLTTEGITLYSRLIAKAVRAG